MTDAGVQLNMTQKVVGGCILGLLAWTAYNVQDTAKQVAVLDARVESATDLRQRVTTLETENAAAVQRMNNLAERITSVEQDVRGSQ